MKNLLMAVSLVAVLSSLGCEPPAARRNDLPGQLREDGANHNEQLAPGNDLKETAANQDRGPGGPFDHSVSRARNTIDALEEMFYTGDKNK